MYCLLAGLLIFCLTCLILLLSIGWCWIKRLQTTSWSWVNLPLNGPTCSWYDLLGVWTIILPRDSRGPWADHPWLMKSNARHHPHKIFPAQAGKKEVEELLIKLLNLLGLIAPMSLVIHQGKIIFNIASWDQRNNYIYNLIFRLSLFRPSRATIASYYIT